MATCLVTGANRGIGYAYCHHLKAQGDTVIAVCRTASEELRQLRVQVEEGVDITSDASIAELCDRLGDVAIDLLMNNAGMAQRVTLDNLDFDSIRQQFEVNALGALRVTRSIPHLAVLDAHSRLIYCRVKRVRWGLNTPSVPPVTTNTICWVKASPICITTT
jgi:NAD(P)-dependent dehydrogenase (short-subunit alcohol dehydrogenase family)